MKDEEQYNRKLRRLKGTNMKKMRKEMPPATRIMEDESNKRKSNNWRDYLDDIDDWGSN